MSMLKLTPNGIFPIVFDKDGQSLDKKPKTGYDFPGTIQGEGKRISCNASAIY
jgi:7-carboxy-7-deazaguanine synthase